MKILLINAASSESKEINTLDRLLNISFPSVVDVQRIDLNSKNISPCNAAMHCQIKNPGICIRKDDMQEILPAFIQADVVVITTTLFCGGYCSTLKKFIDRLCPVLTACFEQRNGETWHISRYEKRPLIIGIGYADNPTHSKQIFTHLFSRNMEQMNISRHFCQLFQCGQQEHELQNQYQEMFSQAGVLLC